jgi:hypothetical protein
MLHSLQQRAERNDLIVRMRDQEYRSPINLGKVRHVRSDAIFLRRVTLSRAI